MASTPRTGFYDEDREASRRLRRRGARLLRVPATRFDHGKEGRTASGSLRRERHYARTGQLLVLQHADRVLPRVPLLLARAARAVADHIRDGDGWGAAGLVLATADGPFPLRDRPVASPVMKPLLRVLVVALALTAGVLAAPGTAVAAPTSVGYDVSHPQCGSTLPPAGAFAVVGVNGGLSTKANPCLAAQLSWASRSNGSVTAQPAAQLYLNTANPGELRAQVRTWPTAGSTPYGECAGENDTACSWQYGYERARNSVQSFFEPAAREAQVDSVVSRYTWWLDVETMNTWQSGSVEALARNRATLEGMTTYLLARGGEVGLYSTSYQWGQIVGTVPSTSNLVTRDSWLAGATTLEQAESNCDRAPLVPGGRVTLTQYVPDDLDQNHSCI